MFFKFQMLLVPIKLQLRGLYFPAATIAHGEHVDLRAKTGSVCFLFITLREDDAGTSCLPRKLFSLQYKRAVLEMGSVICSLLSCLHSILP